MEPVDYFRYSFLGFADPISSWTHLLAACVSLFLGVRLCVRFRGPLLYRFGLIIFVICTVFMLSMSGVYHLLAHNGTGRYVMQHLDYASICLMIAGTFTPIHLLLFEGWKRWGVLIFIWVIAINGVVFMTVFFDVFPEWLALVFFLAMGWAGAYSGVLAMREYDWELVRPLAYGGIAYSMGAILDVFDSLTLIPGILGTHELFHFAIIIGIMYHWRFIEQAILCSKVEYMSLSESE